MKRVRLTFLTVVLMVATVASAQLSWGVQGGLNVSKFNRCALNSARLGFNIGILTDYAFAPNMGIRSGLYFTTKGRSGRWDLCGPRGDIPPLPYLQIPVHFAYKIDVSAQTRFVFHAGPYFALGLGNEFGNNYRYQPFDFGVGLGIGAEFGRFLTGVGLDMGLIDISNFSNRTRNQNAFFTVGYRF